MEKKKEKEVNLIEEVRKNSTSVIFSDALDRCSSISEWESENGRGFWGNESSGYLTDDYVNNM